jgi:hypothetical protein
MADLRKLTETSVIETEVLSSACSSPVSSRLSQQPTVPIGIVPIPTSIESRSPQLRPVNEWNKGCFFSTASIVCCSPRFFIACREHLLVLAERGHRRLRRDDCLQLAAFHRTSWSPVWLTFSAFAIALVAARLFLGRTPDKLGRAKVALACVFVEPPTIIAFFIVFSQGPPT